MILAFIRIPFRYPVQWFVSFFIPGPSEWTEPILAAVAGNIDFGAGWQIEPLHNSFQRKQNVFLLRSESAGSYLIKLDHSRSDPDLAGEAHALRALADTPIPAPALVQAGTIPNPPDPPISFLLMEYLEGVPLNWIYYRAPKAERRAYLEQVARLVGQLAGLRAARVPGEPRFGRFAGPVTRRAGGLACERLAPYPGETIGPFFDLESMYQQRIELWLARLEERSKQHAARLRKAWRSLDRAVLSEDVPASFAHADIAPMNLIVDPQEKSIRGLVDWEMAGFYPADMDYHSLLYYDRQQDWKWCGPGDVEMAAEILGRLSPGKPDGYDARLAWFDLLQLARDLCSYRDWFRGQPEHQADYKQALLRRMKAFLASVLED